MLFFGNAAKIINSYVSAACISALGLLLSVLKTLLLEKEHLMAKTKQELDELQEFKVSVCSRRAR